MFKKLLIANRGEIACRIIKTARKMGIKTVAVYSEADTNSAHVSMADEAVFVGPSPSTQSYLNIENIMDAIISTGADAVHPGYGFLSENMNFARAVEKEGIAFVGPSQDSIKMMGDKIEAKTIAIEANVSTIPGYMGIIKDEDEAVRIATDIGYPVMVKASAGGGGKGMRVVYSKDEVKSAFRSATNEAKKSFSDDRIFIEKFIEKPRHIEIQVLADKYGNTLCLGERECSIQRHNQKVIEEAPSSFIDEKTRQSMYKECVALAEKVGYYSAGTVEFIMDSNKKFYFLEMNTRLQVEHPVTEYVTGLDLVEQMINIAYGKKLELKQEDVKLNGWAIESRIYAEDPSRGFLPSSGRISEYKEPESNANVRVDTGIYEGGQVSMFYDAMIAKLITYGKDRKEAIERMQTALGEYVIRGISHNISFLEAVMGHSKFASGDISTNFIAEEYPDGFFGAELTSQTTRIFLCVAIHVFLEDVKRAGTITGQLEGRQRLIGNKWVVNIDDESFSVYVKSTHSGYEVLHDRSQMVIKSAWILGNRLFHGEVDGTPVNVQIEYFAGGFYLTHAGAKVKISVRTPRVAELDRYMPEPKSGIDSSKVEAPISGVIVDIKVKDGDKVKQGQELFILEAMKMENIICAEKDAKIKKVYLNANDNTTYGQVVIEYENA
ncbi:MAG: acetyl-CoA carboxylase biotin carboxylase subunit [Alphaproteobacteria bacterium CG11_big_fil_rev_8_21_14_0_20_39_49]|nr:MAG: acetyl-CoA carboxylase biotin carboxylase subunit [Alphaproteobacteria bacterium CG11_big_fil_rev_8_21_14_0_20_39_49]